MVGFENIITRAHDWTISKHASNLFQSSGIRGSQCKIPLLPNCEKDQLCLLSRAPSWSTALHLFIPIITSSSISFFSLLTFPPLHPIPAPTSTISSPPLPPFSHPRSPCHVSLVPQMSQGHCTFIRDYCIFQHFVTNGFIWFVLLSFYVLLYSVIPAASGLGNLTTPCPAILLCLIASSTLTTKLGLVKNITLLRRQNI